MFKMSLMGHKLAENQKHQMQWVKKLEEVQMTHLSHLEGVLGWK